MSEDSLERIRRDVQQHPVLIFMKGTPDFPQCGFSATVTRIFQSIGLPFETRDVLADPALRESIKQFSNWPTIPQVYIQGQFVGGCDITCELYESGELAELIKRAHEG